MKVSVRTNKLLVLLFFFVFPVSWFMDSCPFWSILRRATVLQTFTVAWKVVVLGRSITAPAIDEEFCSMHYFLKGDNGSTAGRGRWNVDHLCLTRSCSQFVPLCRNEEHLLGRVVVKLKWPQKIANRVLPRCAHTYPSAAGVPKMEVHGPPQMDLWVFLHPVCKVPAEEVGKKLQTPGAGFSCNYLIGGSGVRKIGVFFA
jgi:hypothetical protein